mmetsp:Transcript_64401/g.153605  ORF Transcript_64401/g.153605 Transcript_64401/m.153605 type:complete len:201 (-) Transcript_64401:150-752(-)
MQCTLQSLLPGEGLLPSFAFLQLAMKVAARKQLIDQILSALLSSKAHESHEVDVPQSAQDPHLVLEAFKATHVFQHLHSHGGDPSQLPPVDSASRSSTKSVLSAEVAGASCQFLVVILQGQGVLDELIPGSHCRLRCFREAFLWPLLCRASSGCEEPSDLIKEAIFWFEILLNTRDDGGILRRLCSIVVFLEFVHVDAHC